MKAVLAAVVAATVLSGCEPYDPDWCVVRSQEIEYAKSIRECTSTEGCRYDADDFAYMRRMETQFPQCFDARVEQ